MTFRLVITLIFVQFFALSFAQKNSADILFTVDNEPVYASEFKRIYGKNLDLVKDESQKDVDEYLKLFVNYKLKLKEAVILGLDKKPTYISELKSYRNQLIKNYLTDANVSEKLVKEAYNRILNQVQASHVLIKLSENAEAKDTLTAYNDLLKIRDRIKNEGYKTVQKEIHNGKTIYAENLNYFSGFKMVYDFENVAYNTKKGEISMPFRTQFGYHIVYVTDTRKSKGEATVAHIMISNTQAENTQGDPETRINDIYKKFQQGESFESLAKQFSNDASSASKGGELRPFNSGQLSSQEFEEVAFGLEKPNDVSKPFKTKFGWHIVKLLNKKPVASFDAMQVELETKIKRDPRSKLIDEALTNKLNKQYNITKNNTAIAYFISILNDSFYNRTWKAPSSFDSLKPIVKIGKKEILYKDFGKFLEKSQQKLRNRKPLNAIVEDNYKAYVDNSVLNYHKENLEDINPDFAQIFAEYRDGLLIFDLMETQIWSAAKNDTIEVQDFYNKNKTNYKSNKSIKATIASSSNKNILKKAEKLMKSKKSLEDIKNTLNVNDKINIIFTNGLFESDDQALPKNFKFKTGISKIYKHNDTYSIVNVEEVLAEKIKTFEEAKGQVSSDYQDNLEKKWLASLRSKYKVAINENVLENVKTQINN